MNSFPIFIYSQKGKNSESCQPTTFAFKSRQPASSTVTSQQLNSRKLVAPPNLNVKKRVDLGDVQPRFTTTSDSNAQAFLNFSTASFSQPTYGSSNAFGNVISGTMFTFGDTNSMESLGACGGGPSTSAWKRPDSNNINSNSQHRPSNACTFGSRATFGNLNPMHSQLISTNSSHTAYPFDRMAEGMGRATLTQAEIPTISSSQTKNPFAPHTNGTTLKPISKSRSPTSTITTKKNCKLGPRSNSNSLFGNWRNPVKSSSNTNLFTDNNLSTSTSPLSIVNFFENLPKSSTLGATNDDVFATTTAANPNENPNNAVVKSLENVSPEKEDD